ncbi:unnamed protein product [Euphydryas editha]|uniref:Uncharacterized protein n=1 Tax=Euphydryas editha TaxID=104508 RepID=A0AAU9TXX7_EUPED|nr:unnamed protein product [Euphydryas editha]
MRLNFDSNHVWSNVRDVAPFGTCCATYPLTTIKRPLKQTKSITSLLAVTSKTNQFKMMKIIIFISALVAIAVAKPSLVSAPLIAAPAPVVTATSSQYYHRINNGFAAYVAAPAAYVAPAASYVAAAPAPYVAAASPYVYAY